MRHHTKYHVWQRAMELAVAVHHATEPLTARDVPGLRAQLRRAAASVPANISEGAGQQTDAQFARFVAIAIASLQEVEHHLTYGCAMGALSAEDIAPLTREIAQIRRMARALHRTLTH